MIHFLQGLHTVSHSLCLESVGTDDRGKLEFAARRREARLLQMSVGALYVVRPPCRRSAGFQPPERNVGPLEAVKNK